MTHSFTIDSTIEGVSIDEFKRLAADTALHEAVCRRIPGDNLEIIESQIQDNIYTLRRAYNLQVNMPDIAKKLLKDAFRLKRTDIRPLAKVNLRASNSVFLQLNSFLNQIVFVYSYSVLLISENA